MNEKCSIIELEEFAPALKVILLTLDERQQRQLVGGIALSATKDTKKAIIDKLHEITGLSKRRIKRGQAEVRRALAAADNGDTQSLRYFIYNDMGDDDKEIPPAGNEASQTQSGSATPTQEQGTGTAPVQDQGKETKPEGKCAQLQSKVFPELSPPKPKGRRRKNPNPRKRRVRRRGAGRPSYQKIYPTLDEDVLHIVERHYGGDPESERVWTSLSRENIKEELLKMVDEDGNPKYPKKISCNVIAQALHGLGFSLQRNKKYVPTIEGHEDREKQFDNINRVRDAFSMNDIRSQLSAEIQHRGHILRLSQEAEQKMATLDEYADINTNDPAVFEITQLPKKQGYAILGRTFRYKKDARKKLKEYNEAVRAKKTYELCRYLENEIKSGRAKVVSADAKNMELIGGQAQDGAEQRPIGSPLLAFDHDFIIEWENDESGKIIPYGIYDIFTKEGFVVLGRTHDTAQFAANAFRAYWAYLKKADPNLPLTTLFILCDGGGCNASRSKLWKYEMIKLAHELKLTLVIMHYPPGTSKYNLIEHRMFSMISKNWRGMILYTVGIAVQLIRHTKTKTGLKIDCIVDDTDYQTGLRFDRAQNAKIDELVYSFSDCEQWSYIINGRDITDDDIKILGAPSTKDDGAIQAGTAGEDGKRDKSEAPKDANKGGEGGKSKKSNATKGRKREVA